MKFVLQLLFSARSRCMNRVRYWSSLYRHKSRGTKDIGRVQVDKAPSKREWIKIDSDFQKYAFMNVKMNPFQS